MTYAVRGESRVQASVFWPCVVFFQNSVRRADRKCATHFLFREFFIDSNANSHSERKCARVLPLFPSNPSGSNASLHSECKCANRKPPRGIHSESAHSAPSQEPEFQLRYRQRLTDVVRRTWSDYAGWLCRAISSVNELFMFGQHMCALLPEWCFELQSRFERQCVVHAPPLLNRC